MISQQGKRLKNGNEIPLRQHELHFVHLLFSTKNKLKNYFTNLTHRCQCSGSVDGYTMVCICFCFGTACDTILLALATVTTISCSLAGHMGQCSVNLS
jgi:hypothetical protein